MRKFHDDAGVVTGKLSLAKGELLQGEKKILDALE